MIKQNYFSKKSTKNKKVDTIGFLINSRGTLPTFVSDIGKTFKLYEKLLFEISKEAIVSSIQIF